MGGLGGRMPPPWKDFEFHILELNQIGSCLWDSIDIFDPDSIFEAIRCPSRDSTREFQLTQGQALHFTCVLPLHFNSLRRSLRHIVCGQSAGSLQHNPITGLLKGVVYSFVWKSTLFKTLTLVIKGFQKIKPAYIKEAAFGRLPQRGWAAPRPTPSWEPFMEAGFNSWKLLITQLCVLKNVVFPKHICWNTYICFSNPGRSGGYL